MILNDSAAESGFTIVELIVASAIVVVLAALSIQAFIIHREDAYHKTAMQMMAQARTALEAGKVDSESFPDSNLTCDQKIPGPATAGDGSLIVPGLVLPESFHVHVFHNPGCTTEGCMEDYIIARHCKANKRVVFWNSYKVGTAVVYNGDAGESC